MNEAFAKWPRAFSFQRSVNNHPEWLHEEIWRNKKWFIPD
jgi:hypothetical protein